MINDITDKIVVFSLLCFISFTKAASQEVKDTAKVNEL